MRIKLIIFLVLIILFTIFVVQNTEPVVMQVFFWRIENLPKIVLLTVTLVFGILLGVLISALTNRKKLEEDKKEEVIELDKQ